MQAQRSRAFAFFGGIALVVGGVMLMLASEESPSRPAEAEVLAPVVVVDEQPPPTAPVEPAVAAKVARLKIGRIQVDAPVITLGVDAAGIMEAPRTPTDVAWYDFSQKPGNVGNVVMAAHVDFANYGQAVFWSLHELRAGDEIVVQTDDGASYTYRVVTLAAYESATAPVAEIVGPTAYESLTLITCAGTFDRTSRAYNRRLVVRAERL